MEDIHQHKSNRGKILLTKVVFVWNRKKKLVCVTRAVFLFSLEIQAKYEQFVFLWRNTIEAWKLKESYFNDSLSSYFIKLVKFLKYALMYRIKICLRDIINVDFLQHIFFILFSKIFPKNGVNWSSFMGFILLNNSINKFKSQYLFVYNFAIIKPLIWYLFKKHYNFRKKRIEWKSLKVVQLIVIYGSNSSYFQCLVPRWNPKP